jgi:hypothetical protein
MGCEIILNGKQRTRRKQKNSWNQGLRPVSAISPAMLGPNNPLQAPGLGDLSQQQLTCGKSEI